MSAAAESPAVQAFWSSAGLAEGARLALPTLPVLAVFSAAFGVVAAQNGLSLTEAVLMSAFMFAGASQFVAADIWTQPMTLAAILTLTIVTATVNLRFVLISASLRPWLGGAPARQTYPALSLLTEPGWLMSTRYRASGGGDIAVLFGIGLTTWVAWIVATIPGHVVGTLVSDPRQFGLDLVMPCFFTAMLIPLWRGTRRAIPWAIAGVVALAVSFVVEGWWFIVAGATAGSLSAGFIDE
jgi:4-azaleucine resistance transporter AzlC